ncbi:MAG: hypothetical protein R2932_39265 [Caldilineaceae bacterium]
MARNLDYPKNVHVTLMHYLLPVGWEHGGDDSPEAEAEREHIEAIARHNERAAEEQEERNFDKAKAILEAAGVPGNQIKTSERWIRSMPPTPCLTNYGMAFIRPLSSANIIIPFWTHSLVPQWPIICNTISVTRSQFGQSPKKHAHREL